MTIIYEVTWSYGKDNPLAAPSCVRYRRLVRGKVL